MQAEHQWVQKISETGFLFLIRAKKSGENWTTEVEPKLKISLVDYALCVGECFR